ncbi:hypothetical protein GKZ90_0024055 [Flavobacterium sp. MC2016-06]|uniref:hypothetical protein n=1 Tax=Flavobacterium sp. MC2016-06 TaxID=2676308 RepID=UPI0012BAD532|nr:hypothetical protein [Flavobacterium sp. MC2016-06]MBU3860685.1 hypothetical protein [Flavobacterium sp. MC2016-06]
MKKVFALTIIVLVIFTSCKKETAQPVEITPKPPKKAEIVEPSGDQCFLATANNSTIELSFNVNSQQEVNGKLSYALYGKDKNEGTIIGNIKGDTLIADYTFMSEGVSSVREVAFLQRENTFIEGFGDVIDSNNKVTFKDKAKLKYDQKNVLTRVDCKVE